MCFFYPSNLEGKSFFSEKFSISNRLVVPVLQMNYCINMNDALFTRFLGHNNKIMQERWPSGSRRSIGTAMQTFLLFTEGSNPSLSVPSPNSPTGHNVSNQITIDTIIPTVRPVRPLFDRDSLIPNYCGTENAGKSGKE